MLLCDIGNTSYHFLDDKKSYKKSVLDFNPQEITQKVYFISVNAKIKKELASLENWVDVSTHVDMRQYYETMGIDRIFAIEATSSAIIVDAGSAITVDVVKERVFLGGFIYPGLKAMSSTYKNISPALEYEFNFDVDLNTLAKNSKDAISYGALKLLHTEVLSYNLPVILTGGDAKYLKKIFKHATIDNKLIFKGMQELIDKKL